MDEGSKCKGKRMKLYKYCRETWVTASLTLVQEKAFKIKTQNAEAIKDCSFEYIKIFKFFHGKKRKPS